MNLGVNCVNIGQYAYARQQFEIAKQQALVGDIKEYVAEAYWHLGCLSQKENHLDQAMDDVNHAIALALQCEYEWLLGAAFNTVGEIFDAKGDVPAAIKVYQEALRHAEKIESRHQCAHCCNALSQLYEKTQDTRQALAYARLHHQISSEIAELSMQDRFRELREYDLSRKPPVEILLDLSSDSKLEELSVPKALALIATEARNILGVDCVSIWLQTASEAKFKCIVLNGEMEFPFAVGQTLERDQFIRYLQIISDLHTPVVTHDLRLHPAADEILNLYQGCELRSLLEMGIRLHGRQVGMMSFAMRQEQRNWKREDVLFGSHLANLVQQVLSHELHIEAQNKLENRVTERTKELQQQTELLRTAHNNISILSELGRELTSQLDRESIMATLYQHVNKLMPAESLAIGIYKPEQAVIDFPCNILRGEYLLPYERDMNDPDLLSVWCIKHKKEIYINDIREDYMHYIGVDGLNKLTAQESFQCPEQKVSPLSCIYAPLIIKNRILGLISVHSTHANAFDRMHVDMLTTLAAYTAVAFENADTYVQLSSAQQLLMSKEKLAALGALVAGIAHEINTPLGNCLLTATTLSEQTAKFVSQIEEGNIKRSGLNQFTLMLREANEMLMRNLFNASDLVSSFKQVSVDQTSQQRRHFNLLKTSQEVVRTMQGRINKNSHQLLLAIPEAIEVDSYPGPYGQVLSNFINNALVHGFEDRSHGEMCLSAEEIEADRIKIIFSDDGKGIKPEHLRRVFDPFFTTKLGQGGSGLGMSIVHNIVNDLLAGSINVDSQEGFGTKITLIIPKYAPET
jgi:signal transduction histidine kinase/tetratricopeptide (TPR) repeat protein